MVNVERRFTPQEKVSSDAFRIEYKPNISENVLIDDVISYLGEYRFNLPKYSYTLKFSDGKLRDPHRNDSMEELSQRAIDRKVKEGRSSVRERAEKKGFQSLNMQLASSKIGDSIIWASPKGPKEEGYGDYGFVYFGRVEESNLGEKNIKMIAMKVDNPSIDQFGKVIYMLTLEKANYTTPEEFLVNPYVFTQGLKEGYVDAILKIVFNFKPNEKEQEKFRKIIKKILPLIYDFAKNPWRSRHDLYALENYALELKRDYEILNQVQHDSFYVSPRLKDIVGDYGHKPPIAAGSCGSTGNSNGIKSSNIFNALSSLNSFLSEDKYGSRTFECPSCGKANIRIKDKLISNCQHCGKNVTC